MDKRQRPKPEPIPDNKRKRPAGSCIPIIQAKVKAAQRDQARKGSIGSDGFPKGGNVVKKALSGTEGMVFFAAIGVAGELCRQAGAAIGRFLFGIGRQAMGAMPAGSSATAATVAATRPVERRATRSRLPRQEFGGETGGTGTAPNSARKVAPAPKPDFKPPTPLEKSRAMGQDVRQAAKATYGDPHAYSLVVDMVGYKVGQQRNPREDYAAREKLAAISPALSAFVLDHGATDPAMMKARETLDRIRSNMGGVLADKDALGAQLVAELEPTAAGYVSRKRAEAEADPAFSAGGPRPEAGNAPAQNGNAKPLKPKGVDDEKENKPAGPRMKP